MRFSQVHISQLASIYNIPSLNISKTCLQFQDMQNNFLNELQGNAVCLPLLASVLMAVVSNPWSPWWPDDFRKTTSHPEEEKVAALKRLKMHRSDASVPDSEASCSGAKSFGEL